MHCKICEFSYVASYFPRKLLCIASYSFCSYIAMYSQLAGISQKQGLNFTNQLSHFRILLVSLLFVAVVNPYTSLLNSEFLILLVITRICVELWQPTLQLCSNNNKLANSNQLFGSYFKEYIKYQIFIIIQQACIVCYCFVYVYVHCCIIYSYVYIFPLVITCDTSQRGT